MATSNANGTGPGLETDDPSTVLVGQLRRRIAELETALRKSEQICQVVREPEAQFRSMARNSLLGMAIIVDGKHTYTNPAYIDTFGYSIDEMLSLDPLVLVVPERRGQVHLCLFEGLSTLLERSGGR